MDLLIHLIEGLTGNEVRLPSDKYLSHPVVIRAFSGVTPLSFLLTPLSFLFFHMTCANSADFSVLVEDIAGLLSLSRPSPKSAGMFMESTFNHMLESVGDPGLACVTGC